MKKVIVISLGGSLIIQDRINTKFLNEFKKILLKNTKKYNFVVVCGGGKTARNYIKGLESQNIKDRRYFQCLLGIDSTRINAIFMSYFFQKDMIDVENLLKKHNIVFCGALRYANKETSDATAAKLARVFNTEFINLTNVAGLYDKDPLKHKNAKFILEISHNDFYKIAKKIDFKPGQHFILDKKTAKIIKRYNIRTFILGPNMKNLDNLLNNRHFVGTVIGV
jgi:predicted uridylate kinase